MRRILLFLLLLSVFPSFGQSVEEPEITALKQRLAARLPDTSRVRLLAALCYELHDSDPTQAIRYGEQATALARRLNDQPVLLRSLLYLGSCYANLSDGPHALQLQQQALRIARRLRNADGIVRSYTGMGGVYHERNDTAAALLNYRRALAQVYAPGVTPRTQLMLFGNLGNLYFYLKRKNEGLVYTRRALRLARRTGDRAGESLYLADLGSYYMQMEQLETAEGLLRQALMLVEPVKNRRFEASHTELLATVLLLKNELNEAEELAHHALRLSRQINYKERVLDAYNLLAEISASRRDYEQAFGWQSMFRELNDSLNSRSRLETLTALQARYETTEKENQIRLLTERGVVAQHRNRELWGAIALLLLGLGGMGLLYGQLRRSRAALANNNAALQEATQELRQLSASKDRLYAIVAHDLRGPVTSFSGVTELIDFYLQRGDEQGLRRLPDLVRQSAQNLNSLLDNLLNWAVSQTGELAFRPERLPLAELLHEAVSLYTASIEAKQVTVTVDCGPEVAVWADPHMTRTILRNLLSNALRFTPKGGFIYLSGQVVPATGVQVSVRDNGAGMPPEQVASLLAADGPVASSLGPRSGTGLGLLLCKAFAQRQGGALSISSTLHEGTTVSVALPTARR